jgi:hypothetical protein
MLNDEIVEIKRNVSLATIIRDSGVDLIPVGDRFKAICPLPGHEENTPSFYFITNIDGLEYISKDVTQHGRTTEVLFNTWDSMFQENKIMKNATEEQETSTVTLTIVERVKSGLFGRKTSDIERDSLTVTYDYRTGRWSGDDNFKDYDGYGYYLGETFEIWFNLYQIDYDNDFIPYWTEVNILGTDPTVDDSKLDPDGDGIPTAWEWKWGYDPFTWDDHEKLDPDLDGLSTSEEIMRNMNPLVPDLWGFYEKLQPVGVVNEKTPAGILLRAKYPGRRCRRHSLYRRDNRGQ